MTDQILRVVEMFVSSALFYPILTVVTAADCVLPLIPSETVLNIGGAWYGLYGKPNFWGLVGTAIVAAMIGDQLCYLVGRRFHGVVDRFPEDSKRGRIVVWARKNVDRHAASSIIIARFLPWGRWVLTLMLGSVRFPWPRFFVFDTIGVIVWALQAALVGYIGGWAFRDYPLLGIVVGIVAGSAVGLIVQRFQQKYDAKHEHQDA